MKLLIAACVLAVATAQFATAPFAHASTSVGRPLSYLQRALDLAARQRGAGPSTWVYQLDPIVARDGAVLQTYLVTDNLGQFYSMIVNVPAVNPILGMATFPDALGRFTTTSWTLGSMQPSAPVKKSTTTSQTTSGATSPGIDPNGVLSFFCNLINSALFGLLNSCPECGGAEGQLNDQAAASACSLASDAGLNIGWYNYPRGVEPPPVLWTTPDCCFFVADVNVYGDPPCAAAPPVQNNCQVLELPPGQMAYIGNANVQWNIRLLWPDTSMFEGQTINGTTDEQGGNLYTHSASLPAGEYTIHTDVVCITLTTQDGQNLAIALEETNQLGSCTIDGGFARENYIAT